MTGRIIPMPGEAHRDVQSLLPWYLAGGLNETERALVEAHVSHCAECQADLRDEPRLAAAIADLPMAAAAPTVEHGWSQISRALEQEPPRRAPFAAWIARRVARRPRPIHSSGVATPWLGWALAGQFGLVLVLSLALFRTAPPARYHALGAAPASAEANVVVIFRPQTAEQDFRAILRSNDARLVDGPTVADAYLLHVASADRAKVLARLRRQPQIVLAEPVDSGATR
jgi:hypothetical protein